MTQLAPTQQKIYDFILKHYHNHQTLPTKREIQYGLEFENYNSVVTAMKALLKKGWIEPSLTSVGYRVTLLNK
jgi:SOS-response transcriptional repressor LexA